MIRALDASKQPEQLTKTVHIFSIFTLIAMLNHQRCYPTKLGMSGVLDYPCILSARTFSQTWLVQFYAVHILSTTSRDPQSIPISNATRSYLSPVKAVGRMHIYNHKHNKSGF